MNKASLSYNLLPLALALGVGVLAGVRFESENVGPVFGWLTAGGLLAMAAMTYRLSSKRLLGL